MKMNGANEEASPFTDYYNLLSIEVTASDVDIRKSWRRKAVELHPDKHPDEVERYTTLFDQAKKAYETLANPNKRAEYNKELSQHNARIQAEKDRIARYQHEDSKIRAMRVELERREREAEEASSCERHKKQRQDDDIVRTQNNEFIQKIKQQRQHQQRQRCVIKPTLHQDYTSKPSYAESMNSTASDAARSGEGRDDGFEATSISIKWPKNNATLSSLYSEQYLRTAFGVYGGILHIVMNSKRCRAIIVYERASSAVKSLDMMKIDDRLKVKIIDQSDARNDEVEDHDHADAHGHDTNGRGVTGQTVTTTPSTNHPTPSSNVHPPTSYDEYEADTLRRMQEAAAKRKAKQLPRQHHQQNADLQEQNSKYHIVHEGGHAVEREVT